MIDYETANGKAKNLACSKHAGGTGLHCLHWKWAELGKVCCWCGRLKQQIEEGYKRAHPKEGHGGYG